MSGVNLCFPKATVTIDKFHVKQLMLKAMDQVRREEQGKQRSRRRDAGKKLLMIPETRNDRTAKRKATSNQQRVSQNRKGISYGAKFRHNVSL